MVNIRGEDSENLALLEFEIVFLIPRIGGCDVDLNNYESKAVFVVRNLW